MNSLQLYTPAPQDQLKGQTELNLKRLKLWLAQLPAADVMGSIQQLHSALHTFNRTTLDPDDRHALLEAYQFEFELLHNAYLATHQLNAIPYKVQDLQNVHLVRDLCFELSFSYKLVLQGRLNKRYLFGKNKQLPSLTLQILNTHRFIQNLSSLAYLLLPEYYWLDTHKLFRFANENKFVDEMNTESKQSVASLYKYLLLIPLSNPKRFSPRELQHLFVITQQFARHAELKSVAELSNQSDVFLVCLDEDLAPHYLGAQNLNRFSGAAILLDTTVLIRELERAYQSVSTQTPKASERTNHQRWLETLKRITQHWDNGSKRSFNRLNTASQAEICFGLRAICLNLNQGHNLLPQSELHDVTPTQIEVTTSNWNITDESPCGYALAAKNIPHEYARAGEIIALRNQCQNHWLIGSVRWIEQDSQGGVRMGVEVLSGAADVAMIRPSIGGEKMAYQPALLLPAMSERQQAPRIIASKTVYTPLYEYAIISDQGHSKIRAQTLLEQQMAYDLFEYSTEQ
ncbi:MAG: hypothetical protein ACRC6G_11305 [Deefgea sp.]